tara:strand:- start:38302 stop:39210 length:909 start_codon:yes stop_codon:yes gene_type:complete
MNGIAQQIARQETLPHIRPHSVAVKDPNTWIVANGATDRGLVRERNEDQFLIADLTRTTSIRQCGVEGFDPHVVKSPQATLLAVADGLGGHGGGDLASAVALDALAGYICSTLPWGSPHSLADAKAIEETLEHAFWYCQERVVAASVRKHLADTKPGTTLTMAYVVGDLGYLVHAGDSRAYLLRNGELSQLTVDHTLAQELADFGSAPEDYNSKFQNVLSNAIGAGAEGLRADVLRVALKNDDVILLCTDGLTRYLSSNELQLGLTAEANTAHAAQDLVDVARQRGGQDNITAIVARFCDRR